MQWTTFKHQPYGPPMTLPLLVLSRPGTFFHEYEYCWFDWEPISTEAHEIAHKSKYIKLFDQNNKRQRVEYFISTKNRSDGAIQVTPRNEFLFKNRKDIICKDYLDLSMSTELANDNYWDSKIMKQAIKEYIFHDQDIKLTREICDEFFDDEDNFGPPQQRLFFPRPTR
jgi:hypothetical protein